MWKNKEGIIILLIIVMSLLTSCIFPVDDTNLSVHVIDVGQGDSIFIQTPNGKTILIDGGEATAGKTVTSYLKKNRVKKIDLLIATHPHSDHIGGIIDVVEKYQVESFYMPQKLHTSATFAKLLDTVKKHNLRINAAKNDIAIHLEEDLDLFFLGPLKDYGDEINHWSAVVKIVHKGNSFLFTGDIEAIVEEDLMMTYDADFLRAQFLKVAHHGSNTSSTQKLLEILQPKVAVISSGNENPYGHPHNEVLDRLKKLDTAIYITAHQGTIVIKSDGNRIWSHQEPYYH